MATATLKPINNPKISSETPQEAFMSDVQTTLKRLSRVPYNSTIQKTKDITTTKFDFLIDQGNGFYSPATEIDFNSMTFLESATRMRMAKVNEIIMSVDVALSFATGYSGASYTPPTPTGDYTVDYMIAIQVIQGFNSVGFPVDFQTYLYQQFLAKVEVDYDSTTDVWSITNNTLDYQLSDYLDPRPAYNVGSTKDFTTNLGQIEKYQYESLVNDSNTLLCTTGYAYDTYTALTASNQAHFDYFWGSTPLLTIVPHVNLTYYGLTADYKPLIN